MKNRASFYEDKYDRNTDDMDADGFSLILHLSSSAKISVISVSILPLVKFAKNKTELGDCLTEERPATGYNQPSNPFHFIAHQLIAVGALS